MRVVGGVARLTMGVKGRVRSGVEAAVEHATVALRNVTPDRRQVDVTCE